MYDVPQGICCKKQPERIVAAAQEAQADALVCACSGCNVALNINGRQDTGNKLPALLAQALGGMPANL